MDFKEIKENCIKEGICSLAGAEVVATGKIVDLCLLSGRKCCAQCPLRFKTPDKLIVKRLKNRVYPASDVDSREQRREYEDEG